MPSNPDFADLLRAFCGEGVEFLVVGAHAVMRYTEPRYTKDLDVWVNPTPENAARVMRALARFGAPLDVVVEADFTDPDVVFQIGVAPNRIDVMTSVAGLQFQDAYARRVESTYGGAPVAFPSKQDLVAAKRASARPQDMLDADRLESEEQ